MKKFRNILAMLMVFVMLVAVMPMNVFAEPATGTETETFKVTFDVGEHGTAPAEQNVAKDGKVTKPDDPTAEGFKFEGWFEDDKLTKAYDFETAVTKEMTLYAKWEEIPETFKVTFNVGEHGTAPAEQNVAKNDKVKKPENPTAEGFKFEGWFEDDKLTKAYDFETAVTKEMTLYAKWTKEAPQPKPETKEYTISKAYTNHGSFTVSKRTAKENETITVTAEPNYGYVVSKVSVYNRATKETKVLRNNPYKYYYGNRYYGRYNDYYKYLNKYENNSYYLRKYDSYREFLRYEYPSHYRYYEDYDYWTDRYDYDWYNRYDNYYYRYLDDYDRNYSNRYDNYEEYLYYKHRDHYRDYYDYRYDFGYYNYSRYNFNTSDEFTMPASDVTVYVEFTDWSYYGYYYDDYYYYRYHRDKKDKVKEEKEEEEKKPVEEKTPQVYEASATINVGSNVFTKVNKNVTTTHQMDVAAYVKNGRVMLPLRYVAEALGLQVSWVPETKTVIIWDLTQRVEIPIKSNKMIVNGVTYTSDVKPEINNSRTMLPIANVARALGLIDGTDIIWDPVMKQVKLTRRVISK